MQKVRVIKLRLSLENLLPVETEIVQSHFRQRFVQMLAKCLMVLKCRADCPFTIYSTTHNLPREPGMSSTRS